MMWGIGATTKLMVVSRKGGRLHGWPVTWCGDLVVILRKQGSLITFLPLGKEYRYYVGVRIRFEASAFPTPAKRVLPGVHA